MATLLWCLLLAAICFTCGYMTGWNAGWWRGYEDFAPSARKEREEEKR